MEKTINDTKRIHSIDSLRGLAVLCMVIYHFIYDLTAMYGISDINLKNLYPFQQFICWSFIIISGISYNLSSNSKYASLKIFFIALGLSIVTQIFAPDFEIKFGILHLLGSSGLILYFVTRGRAADFKISSLILSFVIFLIFWLLDPWQYPFYDSLSAYNLYPLGYPADDFYSSDYFPLLPWFFLYVAGFQLGGIFLKNKDLIKKYDFNIRPLSFLGRNSLIIYLLHQPILIGLIEIYLYLTGF